MVNQEAKIYAKSVILKKERRISGKMLQNLGKMTDVISKMVCVYMIDIVRQKLSL